MIDWYFKVMSVVSSTVIPLIKLWLRSQTESLAHLEITVGGSSWQILRGRIPNASVSAEEVIYQGIAITSIQLTAQQINLNIPELLKGKSLRLLQPIRVEMSAHFSPDAVVRSLSSQIVQQAIANPFAMPTTDVELASLLQSLLHQLAEFQLQELTVKGGSVSCRGIFPVHAT